MDRSLSALHSLNRRGLRLPCSLPRAPARTFFALPCGHFVNRDKSRNGHYTQYRGLDILCRRLTCSHRSYAFRMRIHSIHSRPRNGRPFAGASLTIEQGARQLAATEQHTGCVEAQTSIIVMLRRSTAVHGQSHEACIGSECHLIHAHQFGCITYLYDVRSSVAA